MRKTNIDNLGESILKRIGTSKDKVIPKTPSIRKTNMSNSAKVSSKPYKTKSDVNKSMQKYGKEILKKIEGK